MRYSIPVKFAVILLTAVAMLAAFAGALGIVQVAELGLYTDGFDSWVQNRMTWQAHALAEDLTDRYAVRTLTNCSEELLEELGYWYIFQDSVHWTGLNEDSYAYVIADGEENTLSESAGLLPDSQVFTYQTAMSVQFPVLMTTEALIEEIYGTEYVRQQTIYSELYDGKPVTIRYYESPAYMVDIALDMDAVMDRSGTSLSLVELIYRMRYSLMVIMAVSMILLAAGVVYLCCAAGKTNRNSPVNPSGLNRIPLDIYAVAGTAIGITLGMLAEEMINYWIFSMDNLNAGTLVMVGLVLLGVALIIVGFLCALSAQLKMKDRYWWDRTVLRWLFRWLRRGMQAVLEWIGSVVQLLPDIWQYLLLGSVMGAFLVLGTVLLISRGIIWVLLVVLAVCACVVLYGGYAYGVLLRGAERMAKGDLDSKINLRFLIGGYARCAEHLNTLADVAILAARKQMQSERMKTELITNISHDIKTPLTSIINYVDLLQFQKDAQTQMQYLEVLGRQSQRLKKLIEDLMEMSRATTGNMPVEIVPVDPAEAINQALGEFSDKMDARELTVVFRQPEQPVCMLADGRLTWRVLSNLLSNVYKYALPGTRVYVDITELENRVLLSLKNISREPLNIAAEELTERFVRGDASRKTEGSGLGLNIAKSLMELQKGQLQLLIDGDLFKATLVFPKA